MHKMICCYYMIYYHMIRHYPQNDLLLSQSIFSPIPIYIFSLSYYQVLSIYYFLTIFLLSSCYLLAIFLLPIYYFLTTYLLLVYHQLTIYLLPIYYYLSTCLLLSYFYFSIQFLLVYYYLIIDLVLVYFYLTCIFLSYYYLSIYFTTVLQQGYIAYWIIQFQMIWGMGHIRFSRFGSRYLQGIDYSNWGVQRLLIMG